MVIFKFKEDVYICNVYIPPNNSKVINTDDFDFFDSIELGIINYNDIGQTYISGDLNSRTSISLDYIQNDKYLNSYLLNPVNTHDISSRANKDHVIDANDRRLLNLCQSTGMLIANSRLYKDTTGEFTNQSQLGTSTVD